MGGAGAAVIRERIYVFGGGGGIYGTKTSSAERFDGAWTTAPSMTRLRALCTTAVIAEKLYACGGEARRTHITVCFSRFLCLPLVCAVSVLHILCLVAQVVQ